MRNVVETVSVTAAEASHDKTISSGRCERPLTLAAGSPASHSPVGRQSRSLRSAGRTATLKPDQMSRG